MSTAISNTGNEAASYRLPKAIFALQFICVGLGYLLYTFNRTAFPIGLKAISGSLGFTVLQASTLGTIFLVGQGIIGIPAGFLNQGGAGARGVTQRTAAVMLLGTVGTGVMSLVLSFLAFNYPLTVAYRILFGVFEGLFNISVYSFAATAWPERRAFVSTLLGFFYATGAMLGPLVFSSILATSHTDSGWRYGLSVFGISTIVIGCIIFAMLTAMLIRQKKNMPKQFVAAITEVPRESVSAVLKDVFRSPGLYKGLMIHILNLFTMWAFIGGFPYLMEHYQGRNVAFTGLVFGIGFGCTSMVSPLFGWLADTFGRRLVVLILGTADMIALYLITFYRFDVVTTSALAFVIGVGVNSMYFLGYVLAQDGVKPNRTAIATGIAGSLGYIVAGFAGPIHGLVTSITGWQTATMIVMLAPQAVATVAALKFLPSTKEWKARNTA